MEINKSMDSLKYKFGEANTILILSVFIGAVFFIAFPIVYGGDSGHYINYAQYVLGRDIQADLFRTPGYPLLIIATGVFYLNTFYFLIIFQTLMGILMPWLLYQTLKPLNGRLAYYTALVSISTLVPFVFSKYLMTEQFYIFLLCLSIWLSTKFLYSKQKRYIYLVMAVFFAALLVRPSADYLYLIWPVLFWKVSSGVRVHLLLSVLMVLGLNYGVTQGQNHLFMQNHSQAINSTGGLGSLLLGNTYIYASNIDIKADNGPYSKKLIEEMSSALEASGAHSKQSLSTPSDESKDKAANITSEEAGTALYLKDLMPDVIKSRRLKIVHNQLRKHFTDGEIDRILFHVAIESIKSKPFTAFFSYYWSLVSYCWGPIRQPNNEAGNFSYTWPYIPYENYWQANTVSKELAAELNPTFLQSRLWNTLRWLFSMHWGLVILALTPILFVGLILSGIIYRRHHFMPIILLCIGIYFHQVIVTTLFAYPLSRYVLQTFLIKLIAAAPCTLFIAEKLTKTQNKPA